MQKKCGGCATENEEERLADDRIQSEAEIVHRRILLEGYSRLENLANRCNSRRKGEREFLHTSASPRKPKNWESVGAILS